MGRESILQYVKAVSDLHNQHCRVNSSTISNKTVRGPLVQAFLDTHARERVKQKRDAFEDRGDNTLNVKASVSRKKTFLLSFIITFFPFHTAIIIDFIIFDII